jgi:hypothetical protein
MPVAASLPGRVSRSGAISGGLLTPAEPDGQGPPPSGVPRPKGPWPSLTGRPMMGSQRRLMKARACC